MNPISVDVQARQLLEKARSSTAGRAAHMVSGGPATVMTQTVIALKQGSRLDEHENPGEATIHVLEGVVSIGAGEQSWVARKGDILTVPNVRHHLTATTDAVIFLTSVKLG